MIGSASDYWHNLRGEREAIQRLLELFEEYEIGATWATVGFLFAGSADDAQRLAPAVRPAYADPHLSPYETLENSRAVEFQLLFAPDIIDQIRRSPRQEIATHTFSHYYCCEPGQTKEAFRADIESAVAAAGERGISVRSIVFPRNQHNPDYDDVLIDNGIICYRGNQRAGMYQFGVKNTETPLRRVSRLADTFVNVSGSNTIAWEEMWTGPVANVPASMFLRPVNGDHGVLERLQFRRIARALDEAATGGRVFHLWWHPHNFGTKTEQNIAFLRRILEHFSKLKDEFGFTSLTMTEAAEAARSPNNLSDR